jgi:hypothetical protein
VKLIDAFLLCNIGSLLKETLERPLSIVKVVRCDMLVRGLETPLRKENIVSEVNVLLGR